MASPSSRVGIISRRRAADALARWIVGAGGLAVVASIVGIVGFIFLEVYPLWTPPAATTQSRFQLQSEARVFAPVTEEYREIMEAITEQGTVRFFDLASGNILEEIPVAGLAGQRVVAAARSGRDQVVAATSGGELVAFRVPFDVRREQGKRILRPRVVEGARWQLSPDGKPPRTLATSATDGGVTVVFVGEDGKPGLFAVAETRSLFGETGRKEIRLPLPIESGTAASVALSGNGQRAFVGTSDGFLYYWNLADKQNPQLMDRADATAKRSLAVTALDVLIGDQSVVVGDSGGKVSAWFPVRDAEIASGWRLQRVHVFEPHRAGVAAAAASPRDKSFLTADSSGEVRLHHSTTERTLMAIPGLTGAVSSLAFSPKANGGIVVGADGSVVNWAAHNPHPDVSWRTLFRKVWYEGYAQPEYVWQSTGGTDEFEPKYSLVPLILGTMKGTLYALLFAVPIAVLGAIYTSQFVHPRIRNLVKPTVEIMAALPSVVLGFLAGLWLAPLMEDVAPAVLAMLVVIPGLVFAAGASWGMLPAGWRGRFHPGSELALLLPLIIVGVQLCLWANGPIEQALFGGDLRRWLLEQAGLRYDQRNCLVVGFAMGFAIIPVIFTISEDALSNVPQRLISGSLALGATRWQTAMRVVLPTASPGIFSAIMIGFGRAVGETMIVLMATGNTPILDWNVFTGMRTLSANIAVEIPEAPYGSTLYRVLFLAALLLFTATFIVNTVAEIVRMRLRRRFQQL
jgi:phosphate transport system permease protein